MKSHLNKILKVIWVDAAMEFVVDKGNVEHLTLPSVETIGKCVLDRDDIIAVAAEELPHEYRGVTLIPTTWIEKIKVLG